LPFAFLLLPFCLAVNCSFVEENMILVAWDTDRIKSYVFATSKLREIRGASAILDDLNLNEIPQIVGKDRMVYAGGGTAMAIVDDEAEADLLIQKVSQLYRRRTKSAEITGAHIDISNSNIPFGQYARRLNYLLRVRKDEKVRQRSWRTSPVLKICVSCGQYPAEQLVARPDEAFICDSCYEKRNVSRRIRDGRAGSILKPLLQHAQDNRQWSKVSIKENAPEDFNDIGDVASPEGYIGFIYCDGNRIGELLSNLKKDTQYRDVSKGIYHTLREVLFDALRQHFPDLRRKPNWPESKPSVLPFEIIFLGGDDLVLVVAADKAMEIALYLCSEFGALSEKILKDAGLTDYRKQLSLSVAVVLAHASLPIYHLQAVADDLLKSAKVKSLAVLEKHKDEVGYIDFHVVTASASELPSLMRKTDWLRDDKTRILTERPYTADKLETLIERIRDLQATSFPTSKLQMLYEAIVDHSMNQAMFVWAFVAGRARRGRDSQKHQSENARKHPSEQAQKHQFERLIDFFQPLSGQLILPWRESQDATKGKVKTTPMVDVAELFDFVKLPKNKNRATAQRTGEQKTRPQ
jgi:hypothetical protein